MKTAARIRVIVWGTVFLAMFGVLVSGLRNDWNWSNFSFSLSGFNDTYDNANRYTAGNGEVPASQVNNLTVDWTIGTVKVVEGDTDTIVFFEGDHKLEDKNKLHYYLDGDTLRIKYQSSRSWLRQKFKDKKNLTVQIPKGKQLQTASFDVVFSELTVHTLTAHSVDIENVSGKLLLNNITANEMDIETVSGEMKGSSLTVGYLDTNTVSGKTIMGGTFTEVKSQTVSGDIELTPGAAIQKIKTEGISGGIKVYLPENDGFTAKYDKVSGGFHCDFPTTQEKDRHVYNNGVADFEFETVSGRIDIIKVNS